MALIGQIRKRGSWILIVLIGLGLGGFILQDMFQSGPSAQMGGKANVGKVNGTEISLQDFQRTENVVASGGGTSVYAQRNSLWDFYVENTILSQYADDMGLSVSVEELKELEFGPNYSPIIIQNFPNPQAPGVPNVQQLQQLKQILETPGGVDNAIQTGQLNQNFRAIWRHQENLIIKERIQSKFNSLVEKGLYTPSWMAEDMNTMQTQTLSFAYVKVPFDELDNTEVSLEDSDYNTYLTENAHLFERDEETRKLNYVVFKVEPTAEDTANLRQSIADLIEGFKTTDNDTTYIDQNQGSFQGSFIKESILSPTIKDTIISMAKGDVYGPYMDAGTFKAVKLIDKVVLPDSVRARHILLRIDPNNPAAAPAIRLRMDSIKNAIDAGTTTFEAMNEQYNDDTVAKAEGGDLGYAALNGMVKPFNDLIFFKAEQNKFYTVSTQFGIHLVEVLGKKFETNENGYLLGYLNADIIPSDKTQKSVYNDAFSFMTQNRTIEDMAAAANANPQLTLETSSPFDANAFQLGFTLPAGQSSREMVKWAFSKDAKVGKVASFVYEYIDPVKYYDNQYVVVALESILDPGMPGVDEVRNDIQPAVANLKKAELLKQRLQGKSMSEIASTYSATIDTVANVNFNSSFLQDIGSEPKLVGEAFKLSQGATSAPIDGNTGVYVIQIIEKSAPEAAVANVPQLRQQFNTTTRGRVSTQLISAIKENAKIKDNRALYY